MESKRISGSYSMSLADTCLLASKAKSKLTREALRQDHDLRILVSHANMLDNLMDSLAERRYKRQQQVQPILATEVSDSTSNDYPAPTFQLPEHKSSFDSFDDEQQYTEEELSDEESQYSSDNEDEFGGYEDEDYDDEEEEDDDYSMFEDCQLPSSRIYQTRNKPYKVLPTVDEAPLEEYDDYYDEEEQYDIQTTSMASQSPQPQLLTITPTQSSPSIAVVEISEEEEDNEEEEENYSSAPSSPSSENVPSLCYSSEEESEDELYTQSSNTSIENDEVEVEDELDEDEDDTITKVSTIIEDVKQPEILNVIKPTSEVINTTPYSHRRHYSQRLIIPTSEQIDLAIH